MNKKEAIALVREVSNYMATRPEIDEAIDMAIEALRQEPCEDCISRQQAIEAVDKYYNPSPYAFDINKIKVDIETLSAVIPTEPKRGKWMHEELIPNSITGHMHAECSNCHKVRIIDNFCPNCGARMESDTE